jgi:hypothetical protein
MNDSRIKKIIERQVARRLSEAEPKTAPTDQPSTASSPKTAASAASADIEKTKGKVTRGAIGSGNVKDKINDAKALATKNPKELMKRLGVSGSSGNTIAERVLSIVRSAIYGTDTMRDAYLGAAIRENKEAGGEIVRVATRDLSPRDGALYMLHTLTAADNLDMLGTYDNEIVVGVLGDGIVIQFK